MALKRKESFIDFITQLLPLVKHEVRLSDALHILAEEDVAAAAEIEARMKNGEGFSAAVQKCYGESRMQKRYGWLIHTAENTGSIAEGLEKIRESHEKEQRMKKNLSGALLYPVFVIILSVCATVILLVKGLPMYKSYGMLSDSDEAEIIHHTIRAVCLLAAAVGAFTAYIARRIHPGNSLAAVFYQLYLYVSAAVPVDKALSQCFLYFENKKLRRALLVVKEEIEKGTHVAAAFRAADYFPKTVLTWIKLAEHEGSIGEIFGSLASYYESKEQDSMKQTERLCEPAGILITACFLGYLIQGAVLPLLTSFGGL